ncbi:MAG TPA: aminotransferase class III-fold pyridoxal phosphate-dependent enzyme [Gemmatimonadales bacterium]|nr:aminotransferase class III-fold pyridoxal phosphate-dependent enzyme [Gemmatimonadales bacterium]
MSDRHADRAAGWPIPGFTSTGSKRPEALFGAGEPEAGIPLQMSRASGCRVWDASGREYVDYIMALGAVALGYAHPEVTRAAVAAVERGVVGPLAPELEAQVGDTLRRLMPWIEQVRFLKTGAEACAAAVRLARLFTGRDRVLGCGYHGWLDWCQGGGSAGVPAATRALYGEIPFNDAEAARRLIRAHGDELACVVTEPIVVAEPTAEWIDTLRTETARVGALFVVDEVKTACRIAVGGGTERYDLRPDLVVLGKAIANGFPLAAVGGRRDVMAGVSHTWISSTLSTEFVSLAAAQATLAVVERERVPAHLAKVGGRLLAGLRALHTRYPAVVTGAAGLPELCFLQFAGEHQAQAVARRCAHRGVLFKRSAYNFVSLAHDVATIDHTLGVLDEVLAQLAS